MSLMMLLDSPDIDSQLADNSSKMSTLKMACFSVCRQKYSTISAVTCRGIRTMPLYVAVEIFTAISYQNLTYRLSTDVGQA